MDVKLEDQTINNDNNNMKNEELAECNSENAIVGEDVTIVKNDLENRERSYEEAVIENLNSIDTTKSSSATITTPNINNNDDNGEKSSNNNINNNDNNNNKQGAIMEPEQFRKVFIGGLSYKTDDETLKSYFSKYGELVDYVVMKDSQTGRSRGFGFVTYAESFMVDELMKNRPHVIDGRQVEPKRATPREDSGKAEVQMTVKKLFIGGLRDTVNEDDLKSYFNQYGNVLEAVIMKEKDSNKSRGFGFVTFDDYDPVDKIILEKHHTINGINVHTQKALPKDFEKSQNKPTLPTNSKNYNNNHNNNYNNYHNNNGNMSHQYSQSTNQNQNMPNLNTLAQMAASFFAAASANKNLPKSNTASNMMGGAGQNNSNGHRANSYENFAYNASTTPNNSSNSSSNNSNNKPMNNHLNNPMNNMNYLMNQMMNQRGSMNMGSVPNNNNMNNNKMPNHMNNNGPGPVRGGHGRFSTRSGPYNAPTNATTNYSSGNNSRGRMRGGNRNMGNRFNNNSNTNNNQIN